MKKITGISVLILLLAFSVVSAEGNKDKTGGMVSIDHKDTIPMRLNKEAIHSTPVIESFDDVDNFDFSNPDGLSSYDPSFDYYGIWDTVSVNPYKIDLTQKTDTTAIVLQDYHMCDYAHPFPGEITSHFGPRGRRYHFGIDINLETGDTVRCAFEGTVRISRRSSTFGNVVVVRHKNGLETIYAHLSVLGVSIGQHVEAGDVLGLGGNTGRSRGSHLHFEVRYKGMAIDPENLIVFNDCRLKTDTLLLDKNSFSYLKVSKKYKGKSRYYTVRKGDTLGAIARRNGTSVSRLCKLNNMSKNTLLRPGRKLRLA